MNGSFEDITHICDPVMRSLYILYYRLRKRKLHSRFVVWAGCVTFLRAATKTFWNRNWSNQREVLYWRLRCVIDQDPTPDCHTKKMLKNSAWMGLGSISQNNQINKYRLLSRKKKAASRCVLQENHHATKTDRPSSRPETSHHRVASSLRHHNSSCCNQSSLAWPS